MPPNQHPHHHGHDAPSSPGIDSVRSNSSSHCSTSVRHTHTHLTYSRLHLVGIAMETIKIAENGEYANSKGETVKLKEDLDHAVEHCVHYDDEFDFYAALQLYDMERTGLGGGLLGSLDEAGGVGGSPSSLPSSASPRSMRGSFGGGHRRMDSLDSVGSAGDNRRFGGLQSSGAFKCSFRSADGIKPAGRRFPRTSFLVVSASWLEAASELLGASDGNIRVGVLNSASGTTPGGRFLKGTLSQEDCLCRASLLYSCISQPKFQSDCRFYGKNRGLRYGSSNCVIFSPDVPVIREDNVQGKLLDSYEKVSFVTIPAPNAFTTSSNTGKEYNDDCHEHRELRLQRSSLELNAIGAASPVEGPEAADSDEKFERKRRALLASLSDRIHRALGAFVLGDCTDLVLPAFGCGVHGNDPSMVAGVFREMLTDPARFGGRFRTVVFAVPPSRKQNYQAFAAYFHKKEVAGGSAMRRTWN